MARFFIPVLLGTARDGRRSVAVARFLFDELAARPDTEVELVDVKDHLREATLAPDQPGGVGEQPTRWQKIMARADGLVIVTPEYNRGYPGELKLLLDSLEDEYARKPLLVAGVSTGLWGGRHVTEHLRPVVGALGFVTMRTNIYFPDVKQFLDAAGAVRDKDVYRKRMMRPFEEFFWYAQSLKAARA